MQLSPARGHETVAPQSAKPIWKLDVRTLGYTPPAVHEGGPFPLPALGPLSFLAKGRIVVTFSTHSTAPSLPTRQDTDSSALSYRLHALFVTANTGSLEAKFEWPTGTDRSRVTRAPSGGFVVVTPERLILYSPQLVQSKELPLTLARVATLASFGAEASPQGRYLLISYEAPNGFDGGYEWIDVANLDRIGEWGSYDRAHGTWTNTGSISDARGAIIGLPGGDTGIGQPDGPVSSRCPSSNERCPNGDFVTDDTLFEAIPPVRAPNFSIRLVRTDGTVIFTQRLNNHDVVKPLYPATGGGRFAIAIYKGKGGSTLFDIAPSYSLREVRVYDGETGKLVYTLDGPSQKIKSLSAMALSPDGSLLGVIDQSGVLAVYQLPPNTSAASPNAH